MARAGVMPAPDAALMSAVVLNGAGGLSWRGSALYAVTSAVSTPARSRAFSIASCVSKRPPACATSSGSPSCSSVALISQ